MEASASGKPACSSPQHQHRSFHADSALGPWQVSTAPSRCPFSKSLLRCPLQGQGVASVPPLPYIPALSSLRSSRFQDTSSPSSPRPYYSLSIRICPSPSALLLPSAPTPWLLQPSRLLSTTTPQCLPSILSILSESQLCSYYLLLRMPTLRQ